jgi:hypothetical protein
MVKSETDSVFAVKMRWLRYLRLGLFLLGVALILLGFVLVGTLPRLLLGAAGVALMLIALLDKKNRYSPRLWLLLCATYLALLAVELGIVLLSPKDFLLQLRWLHRPDPVIGFTMTPGWHARFDNRRERGEIRINSLGQRDDEPRGDGKNRILLFGDSFAWGWLLDQSETIDKWVERLRPEVDTYNCGVGGYGAPAVVEMMKRVTLPAREVFYLFFSNDLDDRNLYPDNSMTVVSGYVVASRNEDGTPVSQAELQRWGGAKVWIRAMGFQHVALTYLRNRLNDARRRSAAQEELKQVNSASLKTEGVKRALAYTNAMRQLTAAQGRPFHIVIIPSREEVRVGQYTPLVALYLQALRENGFDPVELLNRLSPESYFSYDIHLNAQGAQVTAKAIVEVLQPSQFSADGGNEDAKRKSDSDTDSQSTRRPGSL